jgi:hypothetical protein
MKKLLILFAVLAFVSAGPVAMAAKKVNCCVSGKIEKVTKAECKKAGGKVVTSAKQCKPTKKK